MSSCQQQIIGPSTCYFVYYLVFDASDICAYEKSCLIVRKFTSKREGRNYKQEYILLDLKTNSPCRFTKSTALIAQAGVHYPSLPSRNKSSVPIRIIQLLVYNESVWLVHHGGIQKTRDYIYVYLTLTTTTVMGIVLSSQFYII